jgi:penicillin-binding protein 1A
VLAVLGLLCATAFTFGLLTAVAAKIPQLDPARQHTEANSYVYASDGHTVLAILRGDQARIVVPSQAISPWLKHATVAIEDKRFYEHGGIDLRGMARAVWEDVTNGSTVQGGSTITQQFVKNAYLTSQKTVGRKLIEAALAWQLEQKWTKDQILTAYLNTVYFGNGAYGVEQASRIYFHHSAATMQPAEAALLAGIPEDPSLWDPVARPNLAKARRNLVLRQLYAQGYLTKRELDDSLVYPMPNPRDVSLGSTQSAKAPYFANYVKNQLESTPATRKILYDGLKVKTTLDMNLQNIARKAIASVLPPNGTNPSVALVAIDAQNNPGAVLAMIGGANYHKNQFNLATQGERQPGSAFKPFVYATALKEGISPLSQLTSKKQVTINTGGKPYVVNNYEGEALGPVDLDRALAASDNSVFSQLTAIVGPQQVADTAKLFGILTPLQGYFAIGLGAEPATPLDMARAYTAFADGGNRIDGSIFGNQPRAVESIAREGETETNQPVPHQVLSPTLTATEVQALQGVVQGGTGTAAQLPGREVAGKTGTTENYGDAWFVGFTPQLVVAVWVGYPDKLVPMLTQFHGGPVLGGTYPAEIWKAFMTKALAYMKAEPENFAPAQSLYAAPMTVVNRNGLLERDNGICRNTYTMEFFGGIGPSRTATCKPNEVEVPDLIGVSVSTAKERAQAQPLTPAFVFKPAKTGDRVGYVVGQIPRRGTASAYDKITLISEKSLHGVVPNVVGLGLARAQAKLAKVHLKVGVKGGATTGKVVAQSVEPRTAAEAGEKIVLTVKTAG